MRALILIASALLVGSAASAEDKPEAAATSATPAAAVTADSKEEQKAKSAAKKPEFKPPPGFKVKILGWDIVYCRKAPVLGSRFPKETCMTETELKEHMAANEEMRRNKDQTSRVCAGTACN